MNLVTLLMLLPSASLLFLSVKSSVYYIKPADQHVNISANTLDYYLHNTAKYFVSNTQLYFLPGIYQLNMVIKIQNVSNFSLIGINTDNDSVVIKCLSTGGIAIINSSYTSVKHLIMKKCRSGLLVNSVPDIITNNIYDFYVSLLIQDSRSINIHQLTLLKTQSYSIACINVLSDSTLSEVSSSGVLIVYQNHENVQKSEHNLTIIKYYPISASTCSKFLGYCYKLEFMLLDHTYHININISEITFNTENAIFIRSQTCNGFNKITIFNCNFTNIIMSTSTDKEVVAMIEMYFTSCFAFYYINKQLQMNQIDILKCYFFNNINYCNNGLLTRYVIVIQKDWHSLNGVIIYIRDSEIFENKDIAFLMSTFIFDLPQALQPINIIINNTRFAYVESYNPFLDLYGVSLRLEGPIIFTGIEVRLEIIFGVKTHVYTNGYIEFFNVNAFFIIQCTRFYLNTNTLLNFTSNKASVSLFKRDDETDKLIYPPCLLQYIGNTFKEVSDLNISIIVKDSEFSYFCENKYCTSHCSWDNNTIFNEVAPLDINRKIIKNLHNNSTLDRKDNIVCYCFKDDQYDCYADEINPVYPGQTVYLCFINPFEYDISITVYTGLPTSCRVGKNSELVQLLYSTVNYTKLQFTIQNTKKWCELFLSYSPDPTDTAIVYVKFLPCPPGFSLNKLEGYCQCDPLLTSTKIISITSCNISDQTILHPGNSWIRITANYTFQVSSYCHFHYCLPYSSYLNLSDPNSQCQFNRAGLLCGQCKSGLSTVFGTSRCKYCSSAFLSITVAIALAGVILVFSLFTVNLTVADGTINAFILYINIVSINSFIIFTHQQTAAAKVFVSLANLDLGFEMCFYNGMDDYSKTWLQLAFPVYLIIIATSLIITSRYFKIVQRLTARRALAVLATLFLLSYAKILRTVSYVLFFYSTITDLPSNKTTIVWSVDANVPLFGAKLTVLFTACSILLIIIIPFNVVLIFTRTLSRHRKINYFKPLLDAYQGPYKNQYYFWPGLQLLIRAIFFGLSALDKNINLPIGLVLLAAMLGIHGYVRPFKSSFKNIQELFFIFNLTVLFAFVQFENINNIIVNTSVIIASIHFVIILLNNLRVYQCLPVLESISRKNKNMINIKQYVSKWRHYTKRNRSHPDHVQNIPLRNVVPEVAYNFKEYREPLIGQED